jgi:hypothetical protein
MTGIWVVVSLMGTADADVEAWRRRYRAALARAGEQVGADASVLALAGRR